MISVDTNKRSLRSSLISILEQVFPEKREIFLSFESKPYDDIIVDNIMYGYVTYYGVANPYIKAITISTRDSQKRRHYEEVVVTEQKEINPLSIKEVVNRFIQIVN